MFLHNLFSLQFFVSLLYRAITVLSSVLYETFKNFFGVLGVTPNEAIRKIVYLASQIRSSLYRKNQVSPFSLFLFTSLYYSFEVGFPLACFRHAKGSKLSFMAISFTCFVFWLLCNNFWLYYVHIFRLWTNRFLVHWTHLLVDFCIRKSHGFYSVRLLIFIQLFSSPHYIATGVPFLCATFEKNFICL